MLPWDTMLQFMIDAAQGLVYLHETNPPIYHGIPIQWFCSIYFMLFTDGLSVIG